MISQLFPVQVENLTFFAMGVCVCVCVCVFACMCLLLKNVNGISYSVYSARQKSITLSLNLLLHYLESVFCYFLLWNKDTSFFSFVF